MGPAWGAYHRNKHTRVCTGVPLPTKRRPHVLPQALSSPASALCRPGLALPRHAMALAPLVGPLWPSLASTTSHTAIPTRPTSGMARRARRAAARCCASCADARSATGANTPGEWRRHGGAVVLGVACRLTQLQLAHSSSSQPMHLLVSHAPPPTWQEGHSAQLLRHLREGGDGGSDRQVRCRRGLQHRRLRLQIPVRGVPVVSAPLASSAHHGCMLWPHPTGCHAVCMPPLWPCPILSPLLLTRRSVHRLSMIRASAASPLAGRGLPGCAKVGVGGKHARRLLQPQPAALPALWAVLITLGESVLPTMSAPHSSIIHCTRNEQSPRIHPACRRVRSGPIRIRPR